MVTDPQPDDDIDQDDDDEFEILAAGFPVECGIPGCPVCNDWSSVYGSDNAYL